MRPAGGRDQHPPSRDSLRRPRVPGHPSLKPQATKATRITGRPDSGPPVMPASSPQARPGQARRGDGRKGTTRESGGNRSKITGVWMGQDADGAVTALYRMHYRSLVRLAALLVQDTGVAEELVRDSFVAMHAAWRRLADSERALSYLHQAVVSRSRSVLRHRMVAGKIVPDSRPACQPQAPLRSPSLTASPWSRRCGPLPHASARPWSCCITPNCPRPRSPQL